MIRNTYTILMLLLCTGIGYTLASCEWGKNYCNEVYFLQSDRKNCPAEGDTIYIRYCGNYYHMKNLRHNRSEEELHYHGDKSTLILSPNEADWKDNMSEEMLSQIKTAAAYWFQVNDNASRAAEHLSDVVPADSIQLYCNSELLATWTTDNTESTYKNIYVLSSWQYTERCRTNIGRHHSTYTYFLYTYTLGRSDIEEFRKRKGQ